MGDRELLVGGFELREEARLALAQQRHVVGLLLHLLRFIVLCRHVEEHDPGRIPVGEEMNIRDAPAGHSHRANQKRRFRQRQQTFEEWQLVAGGSLMMKIRQSVVFQVSACVNQDLFAVDEEVSHGALGLDEMEQPFGNRVPVDSASLTTRCASPVPERPLRRLRRSWRWFGESPPRPSPASSGSPGNVPALLQVGLIEKEKEGNGTDLRSHPGLNRRWRLREFPPACRPPPGSIRRRRAGSSCVSALISSSPAMSQRMRVRGSAPTVSVFLSIFTPTVVRYVSEKMLST